MTIGNRIKALRTEKKLSQEYLAEKLGVSRQAVSRESGASSPSTDNLIALNILTVVFTVGWVSAAAAAVYLRK